MQNAFIQLIPLTNSLHRFRKIYIIIPTMEYVYNKCINLDCGLIAKSSDKREDSLNIYYRGTINFRFLIKKPKWTVACTVRYSKLCYLIYLYCIDFAGMNEFQSRSYKQKTKKFYMDRRHFPTSFHTYSHYFDIWCNQSVGNLNFRRFEWKTWALKMILIGSYLVLFWYDTFTNMIWFIIIKLNLYNKLKYGNIWK